MSSIKSTCIVVNQSWGWSGAHLLADDASVIGLDWSGVRSIRLIFPPTTVAYCGMSPYPFACVTTELETGRACNVRSAMDAACWPTSWSRLFSLTCHIVEMDWSSIRQVDFGPCSAALTYRWHLSREMFAKSVSGRLTIWNQHFATMLASVSEYGRWLAYREMSDLRSGRKPLGYPWWENSPNAAGTGRILVGVCLAPGVRVDGRVVTADKHVDNAVCPAPGASGHSTIKMVKGRICES